MRSINDIIEISQVSEYLCNVDIFRKGLYGGGIDLQLPLKINNVRKSVEWLNAHNPVTQHPSRACVFFDSVGDVGDTIDIKIYINEAVVTFFSYEIQPSDTDVSTLIQSIVAAAPVGGIVALSYFAPYTMVVESNISEPELLNGNNLIIEAETTEYSIVQFSGGINESDKDQELRNAANYLYALCAPYNVKAASIIGIVEPNVNARPVVISSIVSPLRITSEDFFDATHWNGQNSLNQAILGSYRLQVFANFIARYLTEGTEWERTSSGVNILLDGFDALSNEYEFYIDISA
jgi:hypothetical protein